MEGAISEKVQDLILDQLHRRVQLLSLSVNPGGGEPGALNIWLKRYHAGAGWNAASSQAKDVPAFIKLFGQGRRTDDPHSTQVQMVDRHRQLIWRGRNFLLRPKLQQSFVICKGASRFQRGLVF